LAATDPVQQIERERHEAPVAVDLSAAARKLGHLPPRTDTPYLTVTLDWHPDGTTRPSSLEAMNDIEATLESLPYRSGAAESLRPDAERIAGYLRNEIDPAAQGVVIVTNSAHGVFETVSFARRIPTSVTVLPIPTLNRFVRVVDDNPAYALLALDQVSAALHFVSADVLTETISVSGSGYPRHQQEGGWSQKRFQRRADERIEAFTKAVAEEARRALDETGVRRLILCADEVSGPPFLDALHPTVKDKLIGSLHSRIDVPVTELLAQAEPIATEYERRSEMETVNAVSDAIGSDNQGAGGSVDVLKALELGQVYRLVMASDYHDQGWADYEIPIYGVGDTPSNHPAGGDPSNIVVVPLEEELIRQAIVTDAQIEIVSADLPVDEARPPDADEPTPRNEAAKRLDPFGGVAALLRW
jgi:Bacterial archaeo-eukaryotic release factor family 10